jgi:glycosyltransferase involved in cell wall biosynthesis
VTSNRAIVAAAIAIGLASLLLLFSPGIAPPEILSLLAVVLVLAASPFLVTRWPLALLVFLAWLVVEDLLRKLAGNDLRVYFIKDVVYGVLLVAVFMSAAWRGAWQTATGRTRYLVYALVFWAVLVSLPRLFVDWRLPVLGLRLDFLFVPLVILGYLIARDAALMARVLIGACAISGVACALGVVQAITGPSFLAPSVATPGLINLVLIRGALLGSPVYRPTGTFVDPGRFDAYAVSALALSLATLFLIQGRKRGFAVAASLIAALAVWISGGRTGVIAGALLVAMAAAGWLMSTKRLSRRSWSVVAVLTAVAGSVAVMRPKQIANPLTWYWSTLNPFSPDNEWMFRVRSYGLDTLKGMLSGGLFGLGPGHESLGKQYIYGGPEHLTKGLYTVEGGYAGVAVELGIIGLLLWLLWSVVWSGKLWRRLWTMRSVGNRVAGLVLFAWIFFFLFPAFFGGLQSFQNYTANAYFWLFSGLILGLPQVAPRPAPERTRERSRVWVISPEVHVAGGTEYAVAEQLTRWRERFQLRLYTTKLEGVDLTGVVVRHVPAIKGPVLVRYLWWFGANALLRWIDAKQIGPPDVLCSPGVNAFDAGAIGVHIVFAKYWERVKEQVGHDLTNLRSALRAANRVAWWAVIRRLEARVYNGPATVWAASIEDARQLEMRYGRPVGSVPVVPHGVDTKRFSGAERNLRRSAARDRLEVGDSVVCLVIGNDVYKKGVDTAIGALSKLPANVILAVAGNVDAPVVSNVARSYGVVDRVRLWPHSGNVIDYYAAADFFLAPSREDAFHMPALEALACELPLVVSKKAGVADLLEDGRNALLMEDSDDSVELAELVARLLHESNLASELGSEGRALAERCSWDANADATAVLVEREIVTPRVLVLAEDPWGMGGTERATRTMLSALSRLYGAERIGLVLARDRGLDTPNCRILYRGTRKPAPSSRVPVVGRTSYYWAAIRAALRWRQRNLVVIATNVHLAPAARIAALLSGTSYAVWCHGIEGMGPLKPSIRLALKEATAIFAPNGKTADRVERLAGLDPKSVHVFPYGLAAGLNAPGDAVEKRRTVLAVARLRPQDAYQGIDTLICAWPQVEARVPDARLEIVGDGADRPRLMKLAEALSLTGNVRFAGQVSDDELSKAYTRASVVAMPARQAIGPPAQGEGFGLAFAEAGAAGVPVVAGRAAGALDAVGRDAGVLLNSDDPCEVADAIVRLLTDPDLAGRLGRGGQKRAADKFSYAIFEDNVDALVRALAGRAHGPLPGMPE